MLFLPRRILGPLAEAGLGAGVLVVVAGSWRLAQARLAVLPAGEPWRRRANRLLVAAGTMAYFCIPFYLWRRAPESSYLFANAGLFLFAVASYVVVFNQAVAGLGVALGEPMLTAEARLFNWGNIGLLALLAGFVGCVWALAAARDLALQTALGLLFGQVHPAITLGLLLPFSLTLSVAWGAKDTVLDRLMEHDAKPGG